MSRSMSSDSAANESSIHITESALPQHMRVTRQNSCQSKIRYQLSGINASQRDSPFQGNASSGQRRLRSHISRTQRPGNYRHGQCQQESQRPQTHQLLPPVSLGGGVPTADVDARRPAAALSFPSSAAVVGPSEPAQNPTSHRPVSCPIQVIAGSKPSEQSSSSRSGVQHCLASDSHRHRPGRRKRVSGTLNDGNRYRGRSRRSGFSVRKRSFSSRRKNSKSFNWNSSKTQKRVRPEASKSFVRKEYEFPDTRSSECPDGENSQRSIHQEAELSARLKREPLDPHRPDSADREARHCTGSEDNGSQCSSQTQAPSSSTVQRELEEGSHTSLHPSCTPLCSKQNWNQLACDSPDRQGKGKDPCFTPDNSSGDNISDCEKGDKPTQRSTRFKNSPDTADSQKTNVHPETQVISTRSSEKREQRQRLYNSTNNAQERQGAVSSCNTEHTSSEDRQESRTPLVPRVSPTATSTCRTQISRSQNTKSSSSSDAFFARANRKRRRVQNRGRRDSEKLRRIRGNDIRNRSNNATDSRQVTGTSTTSSVTDSERSTCDVHDGTTQLLPAQSNGTSEDLHSGGNNTRIKQEIVDNDYLWSGNAGTAQMTNDAVQHNLDYDQRRCEDPQNSMHGKDDVLWQSSSSEQWSILFETPLLNTSEYNRTYQTDSDQDTKEHSITNISHSLSAEGLSEDCGLVGGQTKCKEEREEEDHCTEDEQATVTRHTSGDADQYTAAGDSSSTQTRNLVGSPNESFTLRPTQQQGVGRRKQKTPRHFQKSFQWEPEFSSNNENNQLLTSDCQSAERPQNAKDRPCVPQSLLQFEATEREEILRLQTTTTNNNQLCLPATTQHKQCASSLLSTASKESTTSPKTASSSSTPESDRASNTRPLGYSTLVLRSDETDPLKTKVISSSPAKRHRLAKRIRTSAEEIDVFDNRGRQILTNRLDLPAKQKQTAVPPTNKYRTDPSGKETDSELQTKAYQSLPLKDSLRITHGSIRNLVKLVSSVDDHPLLQSRPRPVPTVDVSFETALSTGACRLPLSHSVPASRNKHVFRTNTEHAGSLLLAPKATTVSGTVQKSQTENSSKETGFNRIQKVFQKHADVMSPISHDVSGFACEHSQPVSATMLQIPTVHDFTNTRPHDLLTKYQLYKSSNKTRLVKEGIYDDSEETFKLSPESLNKSIRKIMSFKGNAANTKMYKQRRSKYVQIQAHPQRQCTMKSLITEVQTHFPSQQNSQSDRGRSHNSASKRQHDRHSEDILSSYSNTMLGCKFPERIDSGHFLSKSGSLPTTTTPLTIVRLPYVPLPVYSPALNDAIPAISHSQTSVSVPSSLITSAAFTSFQSTPQQSPYIPIVPKVPIMVPAMQTPIPAFGFPHVLGNLAPGQTCSLGYQAVQSGCPAMTTSFPGLLQQQNYVKQGNDIKMQGPVSQMDVLQNQELSAGCGSIPVLLFLPNISQSVTTYQAQADELPVSGMTTNTAARTPIKQKCGKGENSTTSRHSLPKIRDCDMKAINSENWMSGSRAMQADSSYEENALITLQTSTNPTEASPAPSETDVSESSSNRSVMLADGTKPSKITLNQSPNRTASSSDKSVHSTVISQGALQTDSQHSLQDDTSPSSQQHVNSVRSSVSPHNYTSSNSREVKSDVRLAVQHQVSVDNASMNITAGAAEEGTQKSSPSLKPKRRRTASTRYDSHTDIDLSDATDYCDITPITSDDEWTPEKDDDEQSVLSSEEEEKSRKSRKRAEFESLFRPAKTSFEKRKRSGPRTKRPTTETSTRLKIVCDDDLSNIQPVMKIEPLNVKLPSEYAIKTGPRTATSSSTAIDHTGTGTDDHNTSAEKSSQWKPNLTSSGPVTRPEIPRRRRKTPYSKDELTCRVCSKTFINIYRLRRHEFSHGDERPYVCEVCGKAFKQSGHRNEHRLTHSANKRTFLCNVCGVVITSRSSFRYHLLSHKQLLHGMVSAAHCEIVTHAGDTGDASHLSSHGSDVTRDHSKSSSVILTKFNGDSDLTPGMAAYDCPHCIQKFATAQSLNCHLESHQEVELRCHVQPFTCSECGRSFTYRHNLEKHQECHVQPEKRADRYQRKVQAAIAAGKPHFVCDTCGKVYLRKETLTKHTKTHLGLKPYQCTVCSKSFTQKIHLTVHSRLHTGSRPFQCRVCRCCFLDSTALARHVERDVCKAEGFSFNVGKRGRKPFHMVLADNVKAVVKKKRESRQNKGPNRLHCGMCSWTGKHQGFLKRHIQRCHPSHSHKTEAAQSDTSKTHSDDKNTATTSPCSAHTDASSSLLNAQNQHGDTVSSHTGQSDTAPQHDEDDLYEAASVKLSEIQEKVPVAEGMSAQTNDNEQAGKDAAAVTEQITRETASFDEEVAPQTSSFTQPVAKEETSTAEQRVKET